MRKPPLIFLTVIALFILSACTIPFFSNNPPPPRPVQPIPIIITPAPEPSPTPAPTPNPAPIPNPTTPPPSASLDSGITGRVSIGPTCPVERIPPDPQCADKPYAALLNISITDGTLVTQVQAGSDGTFKVTLAPGEYVISQAGGKIYPRLSPVNVTVKANQYTSVNLQLDSGIR